MHVKVDEVKGTQARYFVYGDDGQEWRQVDRDVSKEMRLRSRRHTSLTEILEQVESKLGPELPRGFVY